MVEKLLIVSSLCVLGIKNTTAIISDKKENPSNLFYSSTSFIDYGYVEEGIKIADRYIIYGDDESTSFSNALLIDANGDYSYYFNDYEDDDYFNCSLSAGNIIDVYCSKTIVLKIYKIIGSNYVPYYNESSYNGEKIVIDSSTMYAIKITGPGNYTGRYSFKINSYDVDNFLSNNNYVNVKYVNNHLLSTKLVTFNDLINLPSTGFKAAYYGSNNNVPFINDYYGDDLLRVYGNNASPHGELLFLGDELGLVYDNNNHEQYEPIFDNRCLFDYDTYLASACAFMQFSYTYPYSSTGFLSATGTSFFVDVNYAFAAAHMVFVQKGTTFSFATSINLSTSKYGINVNSFYDIPCVELYIPYNYIYYRLGYDSGTTESFRQYDWCVMKLNTNNIPSTYIHSYMGLKYPCDTTLTYYNIGYPGYEYVTEDDYVDIDDPTRTKYIVSAGMSGAIYTNNGLITTYMDITKGNSGGPCLYKDNSNAGIAVGIVSGKADSNNGVAICPINQYNFEILSRYIDGDI